MTDPNFAAQPRISIRIFSPKTATSDEWQAYHAYVRQRAFEEEPAEPVLPDVVRQRDMLIDWPLEEAQRRLAFIDDRIAGQLAMWTRRPGTDDYAAHAQRIGVSCGVRADARRRGVGRALLAELEAVMCERDLNLATTSTWTADGKAFLTAIGAGEKQRMSQNRLDVTHVAPTLLSDWEALADRPRGDTGREELTWEIHPGRVPLDRYAEMRPQLEVMLNSQPKGTLDWPPYRIQLEAVAAWYKDMDLHGGDHIMVLLKRGEEIVAMSEANWPSDFPDRAYQALTAVADGFRGRGYAKAAKARLMRAVTERHPTVKLFITSNANTNAAMLAINTQLGFKLYRETRTYQIDREAITSAIAHLGH